eukprot:s670_g20.t1
MHQNFTGALATSINEYQRVMSQNVGPFWQVAPVAPATDREIILLGFWTRCGVTGVMLKLMTFDREIRLHLETSPQFAYRPT